MLSLSFIHTYTHQSSISGGLGFKNQPNKQTNNYDQSKCSRQKPSSSRIKKGKKKRRQGLFNFITKKAKK